MLTPPLTPNQTILLLHVGNAPSHPRTEQLAHVRNENGDEFGENAARNAMSRLEKRDLVVGSGVGRKRSWAITAVGAMEAEDLAPPPVSPNGAGASAIPDDETSDSSPKRPYTVLEELDLYELVVGHMPTALLDAEWLSALKEHLGGKTAYEVFRVLEATNADNALRTAGKVVYEEGMPDEMPRMAAIARFRVEEIDISLSGRVRIGGRA